MPQQSTPREKTRRYMSTPQPTLIDLFAGAGGLSRGLELAGYKPLYANEVIANYAETYRLNHPNTLVDNRDIRDVDASAVREQLGMNPGELDLLAGGPPCQGFSINAPIRSTDDDRNHLFREFLRFVKTFRPKATLIENVPGLISFNKGSTLNDIQKALELLGYQANVRVLYAPNFGVPQTRWRTIVLAFRNDLNMAPTFPSPQFKAPGRANFTQIHNGKNLVQNKDERENPNLKAFTSLADAIGDLPYSSSHPEDAYRSAPNNWYQKLLRENSIGIFNHVPPKLSNINLERLKHIPPGGNWTDIPEALLPDGMKRARRSDHTKRYGRTLPTELSSTILTKCDPHWGAYFHYEWDRSFTVREAARIQSFPDSYIFQGSRVDQYAQVGNAVPPLLARALGKSILNQIEVK